MEAKSLDEFISLHKSILVIRGQHDCHRPRRKAYYGDVSVCQRSDSEVHDVAAIHPHV